MKYRKVSEKTSDDLGFVDIQDKYDITAAATLLCQPSKNESFSIVIMESSLCGRPVLVHEACEVTKHFRWIPMAVCTLESIRNLSIV